MQTKIKNETESLIIYIIHGLADYGATSQWTVADSSNAEGEEEGGEETEIKVEKPGQHSHKCWASYTSSKTDHRLRGRSSSAQLRSHGKASEFRAFVDFGGQLLKVCYGFCEGQSWHLEA